jgi:hypothetical protein
MPSYHDIINITLLLYYHYRIKYYAGLQYDYILMHSVNRGPVFSFSLFLKLSDNTSNGWH